MATPREILQEVRNAAGTTLTGWDLWTEACGEAYKNEIPLKRYGHPAEVASVIRFLCSRDSSYVNGQTITVDGGITNA